MNRFILLLLIGISYPTIAQKRTYEYDDLNRLSKVMVYNGTTLTHTVTYAYDEVGNRLSKVTTQDCQAMFSLRTGNWDDPTTWSCGRVPVVTDAVVVKANHAVSVAAGYTAKASRIQYETGGQVIWGAASSKLCFGCPDAPTNGLVAYYPFNANTNDESGGGKNLTNTNAVLTTDRKNDPNAAYYFNGTAKLVSDNVSYLLNTSFTISYWAKPDVYRGQMFIRMGPPATNAALHIALRNATTYTFAFYSNDYNITNFKTDDLWHHYTLVYDKVANSRKIFEDGVLLGTQPCNSALFAQNTPLILGYSWADTYADHLVGKLDEVRIYNRPLSDSEVGIIYNAERVH